MLIERDHENYITANQQKRKLNKQRDTLCTLKGRHSDLEKWFIDQNSKLTDDFARVTKLLQDLQTKEHALEQAHASLRRQFFCMHQRALSLLVSKVLQVCASLSLSHKHSIDEEEVATQISGTSVQNKGIHDINLQFKVEREERKGQP